MIARDIFGRNTAGLIVGMLVLAVAALLLTDAAAAQAGPVTSPAEVLSIDPAGQTMTVRLLQAGSSQGAEITLSFSSETGVIFCSEPKAVSDIMAGDMVTVTYHETMGGRYALENVDIPSMAASPGSLMC